MRAARIIMALALLAAPLAEAAQPPARVSRIGVLMSSSPADPAVQRSQKAFRQGLRDHGYVEGQNIALDYRWAEGKPERFDALAVELVGLKVDVILAPVPAAVVAAKRATTTIPIVMVHTPDPVQLGLVASLARPGGNITGTTTLSADLSAKQFQLLKEAVPRASRIAVLWNPSSPWHPLASRGVEAAAQSSAVQLQNLEVRGPEEIDMAFAAMTRGRAHAVLVLADPMTFAHRTRLARLAATQRLPAMYGLRDHVDAGGLMSYWADARELWRNAAWYIDRILKGATPADLPIQQPTRYELVINMKTAEALGITLPQSIVVRATEVIR